jgi:uncharacterized surface protein with fasciclin (FAS1) repeats
MKKLMRNITAAAPMGRIMISVALLFGFAQGASALEVGKTVSKATKEKKGVVKEEEIKIPMIKMDGADGKDIVEVASTSKDHTSLTAAVKAADLVETLSGAGPYTIFAPTDAAFAKVPKATVESLFKPENKASLRALLEHHAAAPAYRVEILSGLSEMDMVDGPKLKVTKRDGKLFVDDVEIIAAIAAKNGIIYVVDTVLVVK